MVVRRCSLLLAHAFFFCISASLAWAQQPDTTVIYVNGVFTSQDDAKDNLEILTGRLSSEQGLEFSHVYNQTGCPGLILAGCLADLYEALEMEFETDVSQFWKFLAGLDPLPDFFQDALKQIAASFDASLITNDNLKELAETSEKKLLQGKKVIIIAHSQGNYFANLTFPLLTAIQKESWGIVSVANPDSFVAGDDRPFFDDHHTTLCEDIIIDFLEDEVPFFNPLESNISNTVCLEDIFFVPLLPDLTGHFFVPSYLRSSSNSESKILADILDVRSLLVQPVPQPPGGEKLVFTTSTIHNGNLGGLLGADAICQSLADAAGIGAPRNYKAWLADITGSPATRFIQAAVPYVKTDGLRIADDWSDLVNCANPDCLQSPMDRDENGTFIPSTDLHPFAWTDVSDDGTLADPFLSCIQWSSAVQADRAVAGRTFDTSPFWTNTGTDACNGQRRLYCFEQ